jgi:hypothetical protein
MLRIQGYRLNRILLTQIPIPLIHIASLFQVKLLQILAVAAAVVGALQWLADFPHESMVALSVLCLLAWATTPLFVEFLLGVGGAELMIVCQCVVAALVAIAAAIVAACAITWLWGGVAQRFYLAAAMTGCCAPPIFLGYSIWHCRARLRAALRLE